MTGRVVDLNTWTRAEQFRFFKNYQRPHYAITVRMDVSKLMARRKSGVSPFRHAIFAIGCGLHVVPEMCMRFRGDVVTQYDRLTLSPTIPIQNGDFRYGYLEFDPDRETFDRRAKREIDAVREGMALNPNDGSRLDVAYLSCLPWLNFTSMDNAIADASDCIPRISWGKIVPKGEGFDMAMSLQVHHALVDGRQAGLFFEATQDALSDIS